MPRLSRLPALVLAVAFLLTTAARGQEYRVKLHRPEKAGDAFTLSATGESKTTFTSAGAAAPDKEVAFKVRLDGTVKVLEVKSGSAVKLACTVEACEKDDKPLFPKGTVITAANEKGKTVYSVNGEKLDPETTQALQVVLRTNDPDVKDDDAMFGTDVPRKVGDSWPVNAEAAAESLARGTEVPVKKENVKGTATLAAVKQVAGTEVQQIDVDLTVSDLRGTLPQGLPVEGGNFEIHFSGTLPSDPDAMALSQDTSMKAKFRVKVQSPDGKEITFTIAADQTSKTTFGEVKPQKQ